LCEKTGAYLRVPSSEIESFAGIVHTIDLFAQTIVKRQLPFRLPFRGEKVSRFGNERVHVLISSTAQAQVVDCLIRAMASAQIALNWREKLQEIGTFESRFLDLCAKPVVSDWLTLGIVPSQYPLDARQARDIAQFRESLHFAKKDFIDQDAWTRTERRHVRRKCIDGFPSHIQCSHVRPSNAAHTPATRLDLFADSFRKRRFSCPRRTHKKNRSSGKCAQLRFFLIHDVWLSYSDRTKVWFA